MSWIRFVHIEQNSIENHLNHTKNMSHTTNCVCAEKKLAPKDFFQKKINW